jgi:hypothetical protein
VTGIFDHGRSDGMKTGKNRPHKERRYRLRPWESLGFDQTADIVVRFPRHVKPIVVKSAKATKTKN